MAALSMRANSAPMSLDLSDSPRPAAHKAPAVATLEVTLYRADGEVVVLATDQTR